MSYGYPHHCPECEARFQREFDRYGFNVVTGGKYWTYIKEIKECCPVKGTVVETVNNTVTIEVDGKRYTKGREEFYKTSWRDYDAY